MSIGTKVIQKALGHLRVHSVLQPASPEAIVEGMDALNSMVAEWQDDWAIEMGCMPLEVPGDELSEPMGATKNIQYCLAMVLSADYPGAQMNPKLPGLADKGFESIKRVWGTVEIPKVVVRGTLPTGQGNKGSGRWHNTFFPKGSEIG